MSGINTSWLLMSEELCTVLYYRERDHEDRLLRSLPRCPSPSCKLLLYNDCEYTLEALKRALTMESLGDMQLVCDSTHGTGGLHVGEDVLVQVGEYESIEWSRVLQGGLVANYYCLRKGLIRKANLACHINRYLSKYPASILARAFPLSIAINTHEAYDPHMMMMGISPCSALDACLEEASSMLARSGQGSVWVLKPSLANKGEDISFLRGGSAGPHALKQLVSSLSDAREFVLQRYVSRPLLLRGRKFHIRSYVVAVGALDVYLYSDSLLLSAFAKYHDGDIDDPSIHLTNTFQSSQLPGFKESRYIYALSELPLILRRAGDERGKDKMIIIYKQMRSILAELFHSFKGEMHSFMPLVNAFEVYGMDFLVDEDLQVFFLEANPGPDMKMTGNRLKHIIHGFYEGVVDVGIRNNKYVQQLIRRRQGLLSDCAIDIDDKSECAVVRESMVEPTLEAGQLDLVYSQTWRTEASMMSFN